MGIWYEPWYSLRGNYVWASGTGAGSNRQFLGDVDGDGWDDAIMYWAASQSWYVSLNVPGAEQFAPGGTLWLTGGGGATEYFFADATGDGKADLIEYEDSSGNWYVAPSTGSAFGALQLWAIHPAGFGLIPLVGDVNGDDIADGVIINPGPGHWYAGFSVGTAFAFPNLVTDQPTLSSWGAGGKWLLGDVSGDGAADAVVFDPGTGRWYASLSTGPSWTRNDVPWHGGFAQGAAQHLLADADGDGRKDAVAVRIDPAGFIVGTALTWLAAPSNGTDAFTPVVSLNGSGLPLGNWKHVHGTGAGTPLVGRTLGPSTLADAAVVFEPGPAQWRVLDGDRYSKPDAKNFWQAFDVKYVPRTLGQYQPYDSSNPAVIDEHLDMMASAGLDFVVLDLTNGIHVVDNYLYERALAICERIAARRAASIPTPKFSVAIGQYQYSNDPAFVEIEAGEVWNQFLLEPRCGGSVTPVNNVHNPNFMHVQVAGVERPLLVSYVTYQARRKWECWRQSPPLRDASGIDVTSYSDRFLVRFTGGDITNTLPTGDYPCTYSFPPAGTPAEVGTMPPASDWGLYFGWVFMEGAHPNPGVMSLSPGWDIRWKGLPGYLPRQSGATYTTNGWDRVIATVPNMVVINSFNEFVERTGIQPADTSQLGTTYYTPAGDVWPSPDYFWDATVQYIAQYKALAGP